MEKSYNPGSESIKVDTERAKTILTKLKRILKPKKYIYKLENGAYIETDKTPLQIEKIYKMKIIETSKWNDIKHF